MRLALLVLVALATCNATATAPAGGGICGVIQGSDSVQDLAESMLMFPPAGSPTDEPVVVYVHVGMIKITSISPESASWSMRAQVDMYWDLETCALSPRNNNVCADRLNSFYFVVPTDVLGGGDGETTNAAYTSDAVGSGGYSNGECLKGDFTDVSIAFNKGFVPHTHPHEVYELTITLEAFFTTEAVQLIVLDKTPDAGFESSVPGGWTSVNGLTCVNSTRKQTFNSRGAAVTSLENAQVICSVIVTNDDDAWYLTTFIFWIVIFASNLLSGVGIFKGAKTTTELSAALTSRGNVAAGMVLAYVFVVPPKPHGLPISSMPASTLIFVIGLVALVISSFYSMFLAKVLDVVLRDLRHRWWEALIDDPKSGLNPGHAAKVVPVDKDVVVPMGSTSTSNASAEEEASKEAQEIEARAQEIEARMRGRVIRIDSAVWVILHLVCMLSGLAVLLNAQAEQASIVKQYIEELAAA